MKEAVVVSFRTGERSHELGAGSDTVASEPLSCGGADSLCSRLARGRSTTHGLLRMSGASYFWIRSGSRALSARASLSIMSA